MSVSPRMAAISSYLSLNLVWSSRIFTSELLMMASFTIGESITSLSSCVTTPAIPWNFRTVLYKYFIYSAMVGEAIAFHASSMIRAFRPFLIRIFCRNTSMIISTTIGKSTGSSFILSISNTMNRSSNRLMSRSEFSVISSSPPR